MAGKRTYSQMAKRPRSGAGGYRRRLKRSRMGMVPRTIRATSTPTCIVTRTKFLETWNVGTVALNDFWRYYQPSVSTGFNNFAEFGVVFDSFKVLWISFKFVPRYSSLDAAALTSGTLLATTPQLCTIKDGRSLLAPSGLWSTANLNTMMEDGRAKLRRALNPIVVTYKPQVEVPNQTGNRYISSPWLTATDTNTPLRGFHAFAFNQSFDGGKLTNFSFDVFVTMKIVFKGMR